MRQRHKVVVVVALCHGQVGRRAHQGGVAVHHIVGRTPEGTEDLHISHWTPKLSLHDSIVRVLTTVLLPH